MLSDFPERWLPTHVDGYEVSSLGRVRSIDRQVVCRNGTVKNLRGKILHGVINVKRNCYRQLKLGDSALNQKIHRLVAVAFHGEPQEGQLVRHLDGDVLNNCASNLAWGYPVDNSADQKIHGTHFYEEGRYQVCKNGHPLVGGNVYRMPCRPNSRYCRACRRQWNREAKRRRRRGGR